MDCKILVFVVMASRAVNKLSLCARKPRACQRIARCGVVIFGSSGRQ